MHTSQRQRGSWGFRLADRCGIGQGPCGSQVVAAPSGGWNSLWERGFQATKVHRVSWFLTLTLPGHQLNAAVQSSSKSLCVSPALYHRASQCRMAANLHDDSKSPGQGEQNDKVGMVLGA